MVFTVFEILIAAARGGTLVTRAYIKEVLTIEIYSHNFNFNFNFNFIS